MGFFSRTRSNTATSFVSPEGLKVSLATFNGHARYYGPGTTIQGRVHLHLNKPLPGPCQLRVVFSCHQNISPSPISSITGSGGQQQMDDGCAREGEYSSTLLFQVEKTLVQDQTLPACRRQTPFHFSIKLPLCSYPPSLEEGQRSVVYSICSVLTFDTQPGNAATRASVSSTPAKVLYMPRTSPAVANAPMHETSAHIELNPSIPPSSRVPANESITASLKTKPSIFIGEPVSMVLRVSNESHIELQSIHLALIRQISYATQKNTTSLSPPPSPPSRPWSGAGAHLDHNVYSYTTPESTTIHNATIPIAKVSNSNSTWSQQLQFRLPSHLDLIPSINKTITPWLKVDYYIMISIPIPKRHNSLVDRLTSGNKKPPFLNLSIFDPTSATEPATPEPSQQQPLRPFVERASSTGSLGSSSTKSPTALQLGPVPIVISSVLANRCNKKVKWPIPNHLEVSDQPTFVRDRFEEEMFQHLSSLESLIVEDDEDEIDVESLVQAARISGPSSSDESDDDHRDGRVRSRVPARFRYDIRAPTKHRKNSSSMSGLGTPPPSPPQAPLSITDDVPLRELSSSVTARSLKHTVNHQSVGQRTFAVSRNLLQELQQSNSHHQNIAGPAASET
ncbi:hypothetical protein BGX28_002431 [Mortierella sp. GBA30]|nr:hypothetical protein BGX28_002431 [Mortierella sp. GBA30]